MPHLHPGHGSPGDDLGSNDEVKVFKDEGDREDEKISSENLLVEEKSSLIDLTESEEKNDKASQKEQALVFGKLDSHVPGFRDISGYLVSPYTYANGGGGLPPMASKIGLPPFFCHNGPPLTTPPPAHCGIPPYQLDPKTIGIPRPALYPFQSGQYPYSMLTPDMSHVTSWHTPSVYPASSGFRNPYTSSLPLSTSLSSDFPFRFSQNLLPTVHTSAHHTLGSSAVAASSKSVSSQDIRYSRNAVDSKNMNTPPGSHSDCKDSSKEKKKPHIKKPLNAFMLYMKEMRAKVVAECTLKESAAINQILGRRWHELSREEQSKYYEKARQERQTHMELYPGWSARDNYGYVSKKKKRKKDRSTTDSGGSNMKKCRARFGLDQQNQWCKPCRRKKKCIRYMESQSEKANMNSLDDHEGASQLSGDYDDDDDYLGISCGSGDETNKALNDNPSEGSHDSRSGLSSLQSPATSTPSPLNLLTTVTPYIDTSSQPHHHQSQHISSQVVTVRPGNYLESNPNMSVGKNETNSSSNPFLSSSISNVNLLTRKISGSMPSDNRLMQLDNGFNHLDMHLKVASNTSIVDQEPKLKVSLSSGGESISTMSSNVGSAFYRNNVKSTTLMTANTSSPSTSIISTIAAGDLQELQCKKESMPLLLQRNPIGANPRDINNPLSVNQLTKTTVAIGTPILSMPKSEELVVDSSPYICHNQPHIDTKMTSAFPDRACISSNIGLASNNSMVIGPFTLPGRIEQSADGNSSTPTGKLDSSAIRVT